MNKSDFSGADLPKRSPRWGLYLAVLLFHVLALAGLNAVLTLNRLAAPAPQSFDVAISITTIHNLEGDELIKALREIDRVSRKGSFITVDAYRDEAEKERMFAWNLTAKTILHVDEWRALFKEAGYRGDYYWFMP